MVWDNPRLTAGEERAYTARAAVRLRSASTTTSSTRQYDGRYALGQAVGDFGGVHKHGPNHNNDEAHCGRPHRTRHQQPDAARHLSPTDEAGESVRHAQAFEHFHGAGQGQELVATREDEHGGQQGLQNSGDDVAYGRIHKEGKKGENEFGPKVANSFRATCLRQTLDGREYFLPCSGPGIRAATEGEIPAGADCLAWLGAASLRRRSVRLCGRLPLGPGIVVESRFLRPSAPACFGTKRAGAGLAGLINAPGRK